MMTPSAWPYDACEKVAARVSSLALVRYRGNEYSVPTRHGHLKVLVRGYVHEVIIACGSEIVAKHPRSYEREAVVYDPLHYLALLEQKTRALDPGSTASRLAVAHVLFATAQVTGSKTEARRTRVCAGATWLRGRRICARGSMVCMGWCGINWVAIR